MFDIGMMELLVIGVVALIVVGPKDLPGMFRTLGRFTGKMRGMAREFQRAMEDAADDAGVKDVAKDLRGMTSPKKLGLDKLNEAADRFEKWQPGKTAGGKTPERAKTPMGPETSRLGAERAETAAKIRDAAARRAADRQEAAARAELAEAPAQDTGTAAETPLSPDRAAEAAGGRET